MGACTEADDGVIGQARCGFGHANGRVMGLVKWAKNGEGVG